jgi:hypothetical protein
MEKKLKAERFPIFPILIIAFLSALCAFLLGENVCGEIECFSGEIEFLAGGYS